MFKNFVICPNPQDIVISLKADRTLRPTSGDAASPYGKALPFNPIDNHEHRPRLPLPADWREGPDSVCLHNRFVQWAPPAPACSSTDARREARPPRSPAACR